MQLHEATTGASRLYARRVITAYIVFAICELTFHWLLTVPRLAPLLRLYQLRAPNGSGIDMFPNMVVPAVLLGVWNGRTSALIRKNIAVAVSFLLGIGVIGLLPAYQAVMPNVRASWADSHLVIVSIGFSLNALWTYLIILIITVGLRRETL